MNAFSLFQSCKRASSSSIIKKVTLTAVASGWLSKKWYSNTADPNYMDVLQAARQKSDDETV